MDNELVSVVIPVYKAADYIEDTLRMAMHQTYPHRELILVDDASPDDSAARIEAFAKAHPEAAIRLIRQSENGGAARARNAGTKAANGRYLAFLDADDVWFPEKLEVELAFMQKEDAAFVYSSYEFGDDRGLGTGRVVHALPELDYKKALTRTIIFTSTVLLDRMKVPEELMLMPDIASEDTATWWQILRTGIVARGCPEVLAIYRRPPDSLSSHKGKATGRVWQLYRKQEGLPAGRAFRCLVGWAIRATLRRL